MFAHNRLTCIPDDDLWGINTQSLTIMLNYDRLTCIEIQWDDCLPLHLQAMANCRLLTAPNMQFAP